MSISLPIKHLRIAKGSNKMYMGDSSVGEKKTYFIPQKQNRAARKTGGKNGGEPMNRSPSSNVLTLRNEKKKTNQDSPEEARAQLGPRPSGACTHVVLVAPVPLQTETGSRTFYCCENVFVSVVLPVSHQKSRK